MATPSQAPSPEFNLGGYAQEHSIAGVSFGPRVVSRLIDYVIHLGLLLVAALFTGVLIGIIAAAKGIETDALNDKIFATSVAGTVMTIVGHIAYHTVCEGLCGSTLGKLILGQVVLTPDQKPCGIKAALTRSAAYVFPDAWFFGLIAYFEMQKSALQQRHGDNWAGTVVCRRKDVPQEILGTAGRFVAAFALACMVDVTCIVLGYVSNLR